MANLPGRPNGVIYRALASMDGTSISLDGQTIPLATLDRGEFYETSFLPGNHVFRSDKPIFVVQYLTGNRSPGATSGDPSMGNMVPFAQYQNAYTISTLPSSQFTDNFLTIIASEDDVSNGSIFLDGIAVDSALFSAIPDTAYTAAVIQVSEGSHTTSSVSPHGITVSGYEIRDSYLYPGGALFSFINPVGDSNPPILATQLEDSVAIFVARDDRPTEDVNGNGELDDGEDLNGNGEIDVDTGIFFVSLSDDSFNLNLTVSPFTPGDGVVEFNVTIADDAFEFGNGTVSVSDGAGNEVSETVFLNLAPTLGSLCQMPPITCPVSTSASGRSSKGSGKGRKYQSEVETAQIPICLHRVGKGSSSARRRLRHKPEFTTECVDPDDLVSSTDGSYYKLIDASGKGKGSSQQGAKYKEFVDFTCGCCDPRVEGPSYPDFCGGSICYGQATACSLTETEDEDKDDSTIQSHKGRRTQLQNRRQIQRGKGSKGSSNKEGVAICVDGVTFCVDELDPTYLGIDVQCGPC